MALLLLADIAAAQSLKVTKEIEFKPKGAPGSAEATLRSIQEYQRLKTAQDWAGALRVARELVATDAQQPSGVRADARTIAVNALGDYANRFPADHAAFDREALDYHEQSLQLAGADPLRIAQANGIMALYYSKTARNGYAVQYMRRAIDHYTAAGDRFQIVKGYHDMAAMFSDRGELEVSYHFREKAFAAAQEYFQVGVSPPASAQQEWISYGDMLSAMSSEAAERRDPAQLEKVWAIFERVSDTYYATNFRANFMTAPLFAMTGDEKRARAVFAEGQRKLGKAQGLQSDFKRLVQNEVVCSEAMIEWALRKFERAVDLYDRCAGGMAAEQRNLSVATYVNHAISLEKTGRAERALAGYEEAIRIVEALRASYSLADRAAVFSNPLTREPYWGRIRILAERAERSGTPETFFAALSATERIRARQFGEMLLGDGDADVAPAKLADFAARLPDDTAVLSYTVMGDRIVALAFTRAERLVATVPVDGARFTIDMRVLRERIARPAGDIPDIERRLVAVSRSLIAPVAPALARKEKLLVLQDGAMNLVPFGLLSAASERYEPLVERHVVRVLPSLRIELQLRARGGDGRRRPLFAVGDPAFKAELPETLLARREMAEISRGSPYLQNFVRLPGTRREVEGIARAAKGAKVTSLLGGKATESAVKKAGLAQFGYVHLATHGVLGGDLPGLNEPALAFADEKGEDGLLTATEASELRLDAEMTVLSACNTGSGRLLAGEGVLGMSRAFLLAGSRSVVVSLWPVADESTAVLMQRLYENKLGGMPTAEALRSAALDLRKSQAHPSFWAPFIVVGG
jgi:CHAT domain-containing protein